MHILAIESYQFDDQLQDADNFDKEQYQTPKT